jgi:hypothetical protein
MRAGWHRIGKPNRDAVGLTANRLSDDVGDGER